MKRCPHCEKNGIKATLQTVVTKRGDVWRCWQCGGEYNDEGDLVWPIFCELCIDPIDKPHVDEHGNRRWRPCPNLATRQVVHGTGKKEWILNICEDHFAKEAV